MNIDIKSVLIGVLLTTSIMLVMGFDNHNSNSSNGRYQVIYDPQGDGEFQYWFDTRYGDKVATKSNFGYILLKEEGGIKELFKTEFELVQALKERD